MIDLQNVQKEHKNALFASFEGWGWIEYLYNTSKLYTLSGHFKNARVNKPLVKMFISATACKFPALVPPTSNIQPAQIHDVTDDVIFIS